MDQIVHETCVRCCYAIDSLGHGDFCQTCGQPVHAQCSNSKSGVGDGCCEQCGCTLDGDDALKERLYRLELIKAERIARIAVLARFAMAHENERCQATRALGVAIFLVVMGMGLLGMSIWSGILFALTGLAMIGQHLTRI